MTNEVIDAAFDAYGMLATHDPPAPNLCDDNNPWPVHNDVFEEYASETPHFAATVGVVPSVKAISTDETEEQEAEGSSASEGNETADANGTSQSEGNNAEQGDAEILLPNILSGTAGYTWDIWDCRDYTGDNSARFYVYQHDQGFEEDNGIYSQWEDSSLHRDVHTTYYAYKCGNDDGPECILLSKQRAQDLAETRAKQPPSYTVDEGHAHIALDHQYDFLGSYSTKNMGAAWNHDFNGCTPLGARILCIHGNVVAETIPLPP